MAEETTQIVREAPEIEAYKLALLQSAKTLADQGVQIPPQMVAEMSGLQVTAGQLAEAGIGGYQPYLTEAGYTLGDAQQALGATMAGALPFQTEAAEAYRGAMAGIPGQVTAAQQGIASGIGTGATATELATGAMGDAATSAAQQAATGQAGMGTAASRIPGSFKALKPVWVRPLRLPGMLLDVRDKRALSIRWVQV
jgi:hypothetical protein